jgi:hypothetical protein
MTAISRLIEFLETPGPMDMQAIADHCHMVRRNAQYLIKGMRAAGRVYIAAWDRYGDGTSGPMVPRYAIGNLPDAKRPPRTSNAEVQRNRRARLRETHGRSIACRILEPRHSGGCDRIVRDGKTIYQRGMARNPYGRAGKTGSTA